MTAPDWATQTSDLSRGPHVKSRPNFVRSSSLRMLLAPSSWWATQLAGCSSGLMRLSIPTKLWESSS